jgi:hypothetical protein
LVATRWRTLTPALLVQAKTWLLGINRGGRPVQLQVQG